MGAGVRAADDGARVGPHLGARPPVGRVVTGQRRAPPGAQLVGDHDVQQRVERLATSGGGDLADAAARRVGVLGRERLGDEQPVPLGEAAQHARLLGGGALREPLVQSLSCRSQKVAFGSSARRAHSRDDAAARLRYVLVARALQPQLEFVRAVAGVDEVGVAIDEPGCHQRAVGVDHFAIAMQ